MNLVVNKPLDAVGALAAMKESSPQPDGSIAYG